MLLIDVCFSFIGPYTGVGTKIDTYNGVAVYFNGKDFTNVVGRSMTKDGYNLGLKYQCVEFVKRYYYLHLQHKMPNLYGNAINFYAPNVPHGKINPDRNLKQYQNGGNEPPKVNDLIVFDWTQYGHVAIISQIESDHIEIAQQNTGTETRRTLPLRNEQGKYFVGDESTLGWLRK